MDAEPGGILYYESFLCGIEENVRGGDVCMSSICGTDCCDKCGRKEEYKEKLIQEFNSLRIKDLQVNDLNLLNGFYVNLEYLLPNGQSVKLLEDNKIYLGNQIEIPETGRCYGMAADEEYLLVCEYGCDGADPQIIVYKKREIHSSACGE